MTEGSAQWWQVQVSSESEHSHLAGLGERQDPPRYVGRAPTAEGFEGQAEECGPCFPGLRVPALSTACDCA